MTNTDSASAIVVLNQLLICAENWVPDARIIGNIRAGDISRAVRAIVDEGIGIPPLAWIDREDLDSWPRNRALTYRVAALSGRENEGKWIAFLGRDQIWPYDEYPSREKAKEAVEAHYRRGMIEMLLPDPQEAG
jgi:hypothetical protein